MILRFSRRLLAAALRHDASMVNLPAAVVDCCKLFRDVVSVDEEQALWEELQPLLEKEGQVIRAAASHTPTSGSANGTVPTASAAASPNKPPRALVRTRFLELYGFNATHEVTDMRTMKKRQVRGMALCPTLVSIARGVGKEILGEECDAARVMEHCLPGDPLHIESPTVGSSFVLFSFIAPTVINLDSEETGQKGMVLLPERCVWHCRGALRWGWRHGETEESLHLFRSASGTVRKVPAEYRFSVQMWRHNSGMMDRKGLAEEFTKQASAAMRESEASLPPSAKATTTPVAAPVGSNGVVGQMREATAEGLLGGDFVRPKGEVKDPDDQVRKLQEGKKGIDNAMNAIREFSSRCQRGENLDEAWLRERFGWKKEGKDEHGFDFGNPEGSFEDIENRARTAQKLFRSMNYAEQLKKENCRKEDASPEGKGNSSSTPPRADSEEQTKESASSGEQKSEEELPSSKTQAFTSFRRMTQNTSRSIFGPGDGRRSMIQVGGRQIPALAVSLLFLPLKQFFFPLKKKKIG